MTVPGILAHEPPPRARAGKYNWDSILAVAIENPGQAYLHPELTDAPSSVSSLVPRRVPGGSIRIDQRNTHEVPLPGGRVSRRSDTWVTFTPDQED